MQKAVVVKIIDLDEWSFVDFVSQSQETVFD